MRKVFLFFVLLALFVSYNSNGQGWKWAKGADGGESEGYYSATDNYGNVYITGLHWNTINFDTNIISNEGIFIVKYDSLGNVKWVLGTSSTASNSSSIAGSTTDLFGNEYLLGIYKSNISFGGFTLTIPGVNNWNYFMAKISSNGTVEWLKNVGNVATFNFGEGSHLITTDLQGKIYVACGFSNNPTIGSFSFINSASDSTNDILIAKYDSSGTVSWAKVMRGNYVMPMSSTIDPCGNVWIISMMGEGDLMTNDTIDGHILVPPANNGIPNFIACWTGTGTFVTAVAIGSGGDDPNLIASDKCGNIYISSDLEFCDTLIIAGDTITTHSETQFIAKYNPNLGCGDCGVGDHTTSQNDPKQNTTITLYPNPAFNECTISFLGVLYKNANVAIYGITGRLMHTYPLTYSNTIISTADMPPGIYQCRIDVDGNGVMSKKLVVMK